MNYRKSTLIASPASSDIQKQSITVIQNHFCFLHVVTNLGEDACAKGLKDFDKCTLSSEVYAAFLKRGMSTVYKTLLLAARLLHQRGSESHGKADLFKAFLSNVDNDEDDEAGDTLGTNRKGTQTYPGK